MKKIALISLVMGIVFALGAITERRLAYTEASSRPAYYRSLVREIAGVEKWIILTSDSDGYLQGQSNDNLRGMLKRINGYLRIIEPEFNSGGRSPNAWTMYFAMMLIGTGTGILLGINRRGTAFLDTSERNGEGRESKSPRHREGKD